MVLFVTTNIPFIFANNTISDKKLSTKILDGLSEYVKNLSCIAICTAVSLSCFLIILFVIEAIRDSFYSKEEIESKQHSIGAAYFALIINLIIDIIYLIIMPIIANFYPSYRGILLLQIPVGTHIICVAGAGAGCIITTMYYKI